MSAPPSRGLYVSWNPAKLLKGFKCAVYSNHFTCFTAYSACMGPPTDAHQRPQQRDLVSELCLHHHTCFHKPLQLIVRSTSSQPQLHGLIQLTGFLLLRILSVSDSCYLGAGRKRGVCGENKINFKKIVQQKHMSRLSQGLFIFIVETKACFSEWRHNASLCERTGVSCLNSECQRRTHVISVQLTQSFLCVWRRWLRGVDTTSTNLFNTKIFMN